MRSFHKTGCALLAVSVATFMVSPSFAQLQFLQGTPEQVQSQVLSQPGYQAAQKALQKRNLESLQQSKQEYERLQGVVQQHQQEQAQAQQEAQRKLDSVVPKTLSESELSKCYEMKNGNNVRQCIEIFQYPDPAIRDLRRIQLERAQQEYRQREREQAQKEEQELYRMQQGQAQKRALNAMPPEMQALPICTGRAGTVSTDKNCRFDSSLHGQLNDRGYDD